MTTKDFVACAKRQDVITVQHTVIRHGPEMLARLRKGNTMAVAELMADPEQRKELRQFRYGHILGLGLSRGAIESW